MHHLLGAFGSGNFIPIKGKTSFYFKEWSPRDQFQGLDRTGFGGWKAGFRASVVGRNQGFDSQKASWRENQQLRLDLEQFKTSLALRALLKKPWLQLSSGHQVTRRFFISSSPFPVPGMHVPWNLDHAVATHRFKQWAPDSSGQTELQTWWRWTWWNREEKAALELTRDLLKHFEDSFVVPWHELRYENLKKLRPQTSWSWR